MTTAVLTLRRSALQARPVAIALLAIAAALMTANALSMWTLHDIDAYLNAAQRLRDGQELYPPADTNAFDTYRYAPWFAYMWIPMTFLPKSLVMAAWASVLLAAVAYCAWRLLEHGWVGLAIALIMVPLLIPSFGNVQPLLVAAMMRWPNPWMVGIAGSLKVTPILFAAGWNWRAVEIAIVTAAILWAPAFLIGVEHYPTSGGDTWIAGPLWAHALAALVCCGLAYRYPRTRALWAALAMFVALPRLHFWDVTFLLAAVPARTGRADTSDTP